MPETEIEPQAEPLKRAVGAEDLSDAIADTEITRDSDPYVMENRPVAITETRVEVQQPQVLRDQARLAEEASLNARYEQRRATTGSQPDIAADDDEPKRGFSLFGRRRKPAEPAPAKAAPVTKTAPVQTSQPRASGDLFGDSLEEGDLEIPAFLRRQAN
jgi:cell division protein FtsZ